MAIQPSDELTAARRTLRPGGYRFTDSARIGAPLQVRLTVVTALGTVGLYGV
jgi:di/tricarboxylate transporter